MNALLNTHGWHIAGWTMLHFLWIGTAIALLGMLMHYFAGRQRQGLRYMTALVTLVVFAVAPVGIAWHLSNHLPPKSEVTNVEPQPSAPLPPAAVLPLTIEDEQPDEPLVIDLAEMPLEETHLDRIDTELGNLPTITHSQPAFPTDQQPAPSASRATTTLLAPRLSSLASHLPWVWLVGAPLTFALLTTGIVGSEKLRRTTQSASDQIKEIADRLAATLPISRNVAVAVSDRIAQPILIGIVRPMILLPSSALTGWTPEELEMVLLHELSHVRRWDNLVNLAQRLIESLLFFHPCVWWISRQVRIDREECVDAAVVGRTAKPQAYAELLVNFAAARNQLPRNLAASAMARHPLAGRIRRILNLEDEPMLVKRSTATLAGFAVLVVLSLLIWQPAPESIAQETKQEEVVEVKDSTTEEASELSHEGEAVVEESSTLGETAGSETNSVEEIVKSIGSSNDEITIRIVAPRNTPTQEINQLIDHHKIPNAKIQISIDDSARVPWVEFLNASQTSVDEKSLFPTLEEQRAADLVYKLLNIEVEKLSDEELKRVKAKKFAGGLKITDGQFPGSMGRGMRPLQSGDLLVGLHVWPTTSLADIETIFQRDDLDELSPLKFYVIRQEMRPTEAEQKRQQERARKRRGGGEFGGGGYGGEYGGGYGGEFGGEYGGGEFGASREPELEAVDVLITGRIEPDLEAWRTIQQRRKAKGTQQEKGAQQLGDSASRSSLDDLRRENESKKVKADLAKLQIDLKKRQEQLRNAKSSVDVNELQATIANLKSMLATKEVELKALEATRKQTAKQLQQRVEAEERNKAIKAQREEVLIQLGYSKPQQVSSPTKTLRQAETELAVILETWRTLQAAIKRGDLKGEPAKEERKLRVQIEAKEKEIELLKAKLGKSEPRQSPRKYLYAGKSFEHWRDLFKYELSTERRLEAIKALAAFGRSGKQTEAAEAIMEVMAEYDFNHVANSEGKLLYEARSSLLRMPDSVWLPLLKQRFQEEPRNWSWVVVAAASERLKKENRKALDEELLRIASNPEYPHNYEAANHYLQRYPTMKHEPTAKLVEQTLREFQENPNEQLLWLLASVQGSGPKWVELTRDENQRVRLVARTGLRDLKDAVAAKEVYEQMIHELKQPDDEKQKISAIRNLAALQGKARGASDYLLLLLDSEQSQQSHVATAYALQQITNNREKATQTLYTVLATEEGERLNAYKIRELLEQERKIIFGE